MITIAKTPNSGNLTVDDKISWTILVSDVGDGIDALNVVVTDDLMPAGFDFEITAEDGSACAINDAADPNELTCNIGTLSDGTSYSVTVRTTTAIPLESGLCGTDIDNTAFATASNAAGVNNSGQQSVLCAAVALNKFYKDATTADTTDTLALENAGFQLYDGDPDPSGQQIVSLGVETTDASGFACFEGLPVSTTFFFVESSTPTGFATAPPREVTTAGTVSDCDSVSGAPVEVDIEDLPLTNIDIDVAAELTDATRSLIECWKTSEDTSGTPPDFGDGNPDHESNSGVFTDPASVDIDDVRGSATFYCRIIIDP